MRFFCHGSRRPPREMGKKKHRHEATQKTGIRPPIHKALRWDGTYGSEGRRYPRVLPSISQDLEGGTSSTPLKHPLTINAQRPSSRYFREVYSMVFL